MTGLDRSQTPKTRPMPQKRTALAASLDIGTSKIACMIARLKPCPPNDALRGRTHAVELIGYSQIQSRGMKAGAVVDLAECEQAVRQAVSLAERMAKVRVESVLLSATGGFDRVWAFTAELMASLPPALNVFVMASQYGVYVERASSAILIGTLASVVTVTLLLWVITGGLLPVSIFDR